MPDLMQPHVAAPASVAGVAPLFELKGISKRFPGVDALTEIDFDLRSGEVHVLFGENGAGKSTLISLISGAGTATAGDMFLRDAKVEFASVHEARQHGISAVFQEFSLVPQLTVEENLFLGGEVTKGGILDKAEIHKRAVALLEKLNFPVSPSKCVAYLTRAEQQMVEIAKAFRNEPTILIFDEPTASLTERETERLFALIGCARKAGVGIIYITHRMGEIRRIGDRITVLRDGRKITTLDAQDCSDDRLIELMTGRKITQVFPRIRFTLGATLLETEKLTLVSRNVRDVSVKIRAGEIVGLAGLIGSGKSDTGRGCYGLEKIASGRVLFEGENVTGLSPRAMLDRGLFYLPPDRRDEGLMLMRGARENIALAALDQPEFSGALFLNRKAERAKTRRLIDRIELKPPSLERDLLHYSGGNQQKVMIAKALARDVKLFIFDEPTIGVDVGTRSAIYGFIRDLCEAGAGILLISSDLPEILNLTSRVYVMYRGELRAELEGSSITQEWLISHFFERDAA